MQILRRHTAGSRRQRRPLSPSEMRFVEERDQEEEEAQSPLSRYPSVLVSELLMVCVQELSVMCFIAHCLPPPETSICWKTCSYLKAALIDFWTLGGRKTAEQHIFAQLNIVLGIFFFSMF